MTHNWIKAFVKSTGAILLAAALVRFLIAAGSAKILLLPDPALGIQLRLVVLVVGGIELFVALICLFGKQIFLQMGWLAWLSTNYAIFHVGLFWMHCSSQATCIGSLTDPLHLSRGMTGIVVEFLPIYLLAGSCIGVVWLQMENSRAKKTKYCKMSCPGCGVHIRFDERNLGQQIPCPHCRAEITLCRPRNLKMSCFFCKENIEFPDYALGEKVSCPHCKMHITLNALSPT